MERPITSDGAEAERLTALRESLRSQLSVLEEIYSNGHPQQRLPGNLNISVGGVDGAALLLGLQPVVAVFSGAACFGKGRAVPSS